MQVVDVDRVLDGLVAELVGRAVGRAALDAAAGQPDGEAPVVVVAAHRRLAADQLDRRRAAELAAADHQRLVEQAAPLQIGQQRRDRAVDLAGQLAVVLRRCCRGCPTAARRRGSTARSARRARPAAGRSAAAGRARASPYASRTCCGSWPTSKASVASDLHAVGQLERLDAGLERGVLGPRLLVPAVQLGEQVELPPLVGPRRPPGCGCSRSAPRPCVLRVSMCVPW